MTQALKRAFAHANDWIDGLETAPVQSRMNEAQLRAAFEAALPISGKPAIEVVDFIAKNAKDGLLGSAGGRFFAWVIGGGIESALAADWLVSTWDQNAALYACSPASAIIEEIAGKWLLELFDLPRDASFAFTTGCQMAHMTSLAAARHAVLADVGWDVAEDGIIGAPPITVFTSGNRHGSIIRALRYLGLGSKCISPVETDELGRMLPSAFEKELATHEGPAITVLNVADLNVGACDNYNELIPMAKSVGSWVHTDGAFGMFARASKVKKHLVEGLELADSWSTDGHKWLNVPFDCGIAMIRDQEAHRAAMTLSASYIDPATTARDQIDWNPEWSRRARGIPVYAALSEMGRDGVEDMVDRCCDFCLAIVEGIGALEGAKVLASPTLNQGLVCFYREGKSDRENDQFTDQIIEAINQTGEAFFSGTTWKGRRAMRVSVVNWRTNTDDVNRAIAAAKKVLSDVA